MDLIRKELLPTDVKCTNYGDAWLLDVKISHSCYLFGPGWVATSPLLGVGGFYRVRDDRAGKPGPVIHFADLTSALAYINNVLKLDIRVAPVS
mgnify:CR=1 FL=1